MRRYDLIHRLVHSIRQDEKVKAEEQLKADKWTKSCYDLLSRIISDRISATLPDDVIRQMGSTISYKTLKTIFDGKYVLKYPLDPRALNTLNKLAIFIGCTDWNAFAASIRQEQASAVAASTPEEQISTTLEEALVESFKAIHCMSLNGTVQLKQYLQEASPAFNRIAELIHYNKAKGLSISNKYNPSNYELLECEIDSLSAEKAMVSTKEFWLLCWWDHNQEKYKRRLKKVCVNQYILKRSQDMQWRITNTITEDDLFQMEES